MKWDDVIGAVIAAVEADATLDAITGLVIRKDDEYTALQVPAIYWNVVTDTPEENTNPIEVSLDVYARGLAQLVTIEGRLRALLLRETVLEIGGLRMFAFLDGTREDPDPEPGVSHKGLDFTFTPARQLHFGHA